MAAVTDLRHTDLYVSAATFLTEYRLHPDPATYLAHGYVDLCLAAWPGARGAELALATRWALWTWLADDLLDDELRDADPDEARVLYRDLVVVSSEGAEIIGDHPVVLALAALVRETCAVRTALWWHRYRQQLLAWLDAAWDRLIEYTQTSRVPTLREYLELRPADGGMRLAAMWCELAYGTVAAEWSSVVLQGLVGAFSAVGYLTNDLVDGAGGFSPIGALARAEGIGLPEARQQVEQWLAAEQRRFWVLYLAVRDDAEADHGTRQLARALDSFLHALTAWTRASSRYQAAAPTIAGQGVAR